MAAYFVFAFLLPWAVILKVCSPPHIIRQFPLGAVIAYVINSLETPFWKFGLEGNERIILLFFNLGFFPLATVIIVHAWERHGLKVLFIAPFVLTVIEGVAVQFRLIIYLEPWNLFFTLLSYGLGSFLLYGYFKASAIISARYTEHDTIAKKLI